MRKQRIEIIYQASPRAQRRDNDIIVINKPSGVSVTKDRTGVPQLVDMLSEHLGPKISSELRLVHRLAKGQIEKSLIDRLTLHAYQLEFPKPSSVIPAKPVLSRVEGAGIHPNTKASRPDCFVARLDKKFAAALKMLTKHNPKGLDAFTDPDNFSKIINSRRLH